MRRGGGNAGLPKIDLLKIDKDCLVCGNLRKQYIQTVVDICAKYGISVLWIKYTNTAHGMHFYIKMDPPVKALKANDLQYLLGDDAKRVAFNKARIESGLAEWNKLFERIGAVLRTIYRNPEFSRPRRHDRIW